MVLSGCHSFPDTCLETAALPPPAHASSLASRTPSALMLWLLLPSPVPSGTHAGLDLQMTFKDSLLNSLGTGRIGLG